MDNGLDELRLIWAGIRGASTGLAESVATVVSVLREQDRRFWVFFWCFTAGAVLILMLASLIPQIVYEKHMSESKQNLHAVQLALERFAVDSPGAVYPLRIEVLSEQDYLPVMPENLFTGQPMRWKVYGSYDEARLNPDGLSHGDFGYVVLPEGYGRDSVVEDLAKVDPETIYGYSLVLY